MKNTFLLWLLLTGGCFLLVNIFFDDLSDFGQDIGVVLIWLLLMIMLIAFLGYSLVKKGYGNYSIICIIFLCFSFYHLSFSDLENFYVVLIDDLFSV
ncbi:hypothetical protein EOD41_11165 [Mucilaginibacter limnophilus]|uniref:Uncharacterized protein n=1 Tax=Mucilaginibacter limnophilus TaxID=1932778 RepID=A0A3S2VM57_9SPHI|nr:hypothetical protein [Mucilaginibacter limnophilus]RVU00555.1 hypothetical protein EOD41_11165 [Mucilaginibacter limnophilus]